MAGTTSRRRRIARVVHAFSRQDQTEQRASESDARGPRKGLCMDAIATRLRRPHEAHRSLEARTVRDRQYARAEVQI